MIGIKRSVSQGSHDDDGGPSQSRRRAPRFRLIHLMLAVLICAVLIKSGQLATRAYWAYRQWVIEQRQQRLLKQQLRKANEHIHEDLETTIRRLHKQLEESNATVPQGQEKADPKEP